MSSWRDSASQQAQDDLDGLLDTVMPLARKMLDKSGEFFPFGASVSARGESRLWSGDPGKGEHPASAEVISMLVDGLRQRRDDLRAAAICFDVQLPDTDAVRVEFEHRDGQAIAVVLPYKKKRFGRGVDYRDLRGSTANKQVWV